MYWKYFTNHKREQLKFTKISVTYLFTIRDMAGEVTYVEIIVKCGERGTSFMEGHSSHTAVVHMTLLRILHEAMHNTSTFTCNYTYINTTYHIELYNIR